MAKYILAGLSGKVVPGPLLLIALLCVHCESAEGVLVQTPTDTTVIANHSTFFNCSKSNNKSTEPSWYHYPLDGNGKDRQDVYDDEEIRDKYKDRFSIEKNLASGTFNLLVRRPEPTDGGRYECVEDSLEEDTGPSAELTVLDSDLVCESDKDLNEIVGPTECAKPIAADQLQLSCSVTYSGNIPPQMQWRKVGNALESMGIPSCDVRGNRVMCNATLEANFNMDGSVYVCQIITAEQYSCSLKVNKTIYTFSDTSVRAITTTEEAFCSANTSKGLSCSYKWYKDNRTEQLGQILKTSNPGLYRCEAECTIRDETCVFTAAVINFSEPGTWNRKFVWLLVLLIIPLAFVAGLVYYDRGKRCRSQPMKRSSPPGAPAVEISLLPARNESHEMDEDSNIKQACEVAPFIGRGLNGNIRGPGEYKGKQCAFGEILFTHDQQTRKDEEETEVEKVCRNGERWRMLIHENLIKIHDLILKSQSIYIVMEYTAGRSIRKELRKHKEDLPMSVVKDWATQIAKGLNYLHENDIVHKNIKSTQIFILDEIKAPSDIYEKTLKIGCSNFLDNDSIKSNDGSSVLMEQLYWSPETHKTKVCSKQSDVWSFSIVIWELLTRKLPHNNDAHNITKDLENPNLCPEKLKGILSDCRIEEPSKRSTFTEIVVRLQEWQL